MSENGFCSRNPIRRKLHYERQIVILHEAAHYLGSKDSQEYTQSIESQKHQSGMTREEGSGNEYVHRHSSRTGHQRYDQSRYQPALAALDGPCGHDCRHIAAESHHHRNERLAVQTHLVHHPVHDERTAGHISGVLKQRYEHIKQHDVRQEHQHTADSADYAVYHQVFQPAVSHHR